MQVVNLLNPLNPSLPQQRIVRHQQQRNRQLVQQVARQQRIRQHKIPLM
ncbi:hypothetical protein [Volucribacter amazonae]|nr:hypothetical protein [Volucribacter amazonae]